MPQPWGERPIEEARLLNPAFGALLISRSVDGYVNRAKSNMPLIYAFLIMPLVLHEGTRGRLPSQASASFITWTGQNADEVAVMPLRIRRLLPISREALLFAIGHGAMRLRVGGLEIGDRRLSKSAKLGTQETDECLAKSALLGRWLAGAGTQATILATWGMRP